MSIETRTIDPDDAEALQCADDGSLAGEWAKAADQHKSSHRLCDRFWLVLRHSDGTYWGLAYYIGKAEMQEHDLPWEKTDSPLELTRLYPHEVTSVEYRTTEPATSAGKDMYITDDGGCMWLEHFPDGDGYDETCNGSPVSTVEPGMTLEQLQARAQAHIRV